VTPSQCIEWTVISLLAELDRTGRVLLWSRDIPVATELVRDGLARWEAPRAGHGRNARVLRWPNDERTAREFLDAAASGQQDS
jgi:hypothetical protein